MSVGGERMLRVHQRCQGIAHLTRSAFPQPRALPGIGFQVHRMYTWTQGGRVGGVQFASLASGGPGRVGVALHRDGTYQSPPGTKASGMRFFDASRSGRVSGPTRRSPPPPGGPSHSDRGSATCAAAQPGNARRPLSGRACRRPGRTPTPSSVWSVRLRNARFSPLSAGSCTAPGAGDRASRGGCSRACA